MRRMNGRSMAPSAAVTHNAGWHMLGIVRDPGFAHR